MDKRALWCVLLIGVVAFGCGGDDDSGPTAGTGGAGFGGAGGAGTGGVSGGGAGGSGGAAGTMAAMPVPCGSTMCQPPQNPFAMFGMLLGGGLPMPVACCLDMT